MAIYHLEAKVISRGTGRSACAASAYMSCSAIYNDYDGVQHDYTRKQGLFHKDVDKVPISNDVSKLPDNRSYFCAAELENSYVIDEKGHVYKCWNEVGKDNYCFSLREPEKINYSSMLNYMGDITFSDPKCTKCTFLPICFGGCKFHKANFNRYSCAFNEHSVKAYVEDTFFQE